MRLIEWHLAGEVGVPVLVNPQRVCWVRPVREPGQPGSEIHFAVMPAGEGITVAETLDQVARDLAGVR